MVTSLKQGTKIGIQDNIKPKYVVKLPICLHVSWKFCETLAHAMIKKGLNLTNIPEISLLAENWICH